VGHAQSSATQQQIDVLTGKIQELVEGQALQNQRLDALAKDISELRDKVNTPPVNDSASRDDLKKLAEQVQEIDKKRQADKELILKNLAELARIGTEPTHAHKPPEVPPNTSKESGTTETGHEYVVQKGDTISGIAKQCRDQGVKVTSAQIIKANPGLSATTLFVGKTIFIPDPNVK
jgi:LysM repeat protein